MINFKCPHCNFAIRVPDGAAGKKGACKFCNRVVQVPTIQNETKESLTSSTPSDDSPIFFDCDDVGSNDRKYLVGFSLLVVLALITSQAFPTPTAWLGRILLVLCVASLIPVVKKHSLQFLRIHEGNNWRTNLKLGVFAFIGMILISVSQAGSDRIAEVNRLTEEKAEEEAVKKAELQRLTKKANERVVSAVKTAEIYWQYDNSSKVEETLVSAGNIPHATNFQPIQELRTRMADAQVKDLVSEATNFLKAGNIDKGREVVLKALAVPHASSVSQVKKLDNHILNATDAKYNKSRVLKLSDAEFQELQKSGQLPQQFISGFQELDTRIAQLAEVHAKEIVSQRKRELERRERERLAAIAAQKASEEKRLHELAAAKEKMQMARKKKTEGALNSRDGPHGSKSGVPNNQPDSVTVYITNTGTKYHRGSCRHLKKSKIAITLERARAQYSPCKVCNPP